MLREVRHGELLAVLGEEGVLPLREIARRLGVGQATARHDLTELGEAGRLTRVHGGAVTARADDEPAFEDVAVDELSAKAALLTNDTSDPATLAAFREAGTEVITV
ncbi:DeoR family transcriptional regulator [Streptomyces sp. NPDC000349]|uniref:DeoR family transcriptional regulator n=1 Tax=unclassified Streptomyces TaxID=2593676 RepID=UPI0027802A8F|nr:DeoR family transcriptional regulator [Streptomyces sp. DSM 40167]MDQ0407219.1 DeoR/GlpR family transcriptional regulator of sugar metabolism [Streptomyces sp. DSM 40167]